MGLRTAVTDLFSGYEDSGQAISTTEPDNGETHPLLIRFSYLCETIRDWLIVSNTGNPFPLS